MQEPQFPKEAMASPEGISANLMNLLLEAPTGPQGDAKNQVVQLTTLGDFGQVSFSATHLNWLQRSLWQFCKSKLDAKGLHSQQREMVSSLQCPGPLVLGQRCLLFSTGCGQTIWISHSAFIVLLPANVFRIAMCSEALKEQGKWCVIR